MQTLGEKLPIWRTFFKVKVVSDTAKYYMTFFSQFLFVQEPKRGKRKRQNTCSTNLDSQQNSLNTQHRKNNGAGYQHAKIVLFIVWKKLNASSQIKSKKIKRSMERSDEAQKKLKYWNVHNKACSKVWTSSCFIRRNPENFLQSCCSA